MATVVPDPRCDARYQESSRAIRKGAARCVPDTRAWLRADMGGPGFENGELLA